jgi:hypothetical protein
MSIILVVVCSSDECGRVMWRNREETLDRSGNGANDERQIYPTPHSTLQRTVRTERWHSMNRTTVSYHLIRYHLRWFGSLDGSFLSLFRFMYFSHIPCSIIAFYHYRERTLAHTTTRTRRTPMALKRPSARVT